MASTTRTKKRESERKNVKTYKQAYVISKEVGDALHDLLTDLPIKMSQRAVPLIRALEQAPRGDLNVNEVLPVEEPKEKQDEDTAEE
jgi:hypothetical protein